MLLPHQKVVFYQALLLVLQRMTNQRLDTLYMCLDTGTFLVLLLNLLANKAIICFSITEDILRRTFQIFGTIVNISMEVEKK